MLVIELNKQSAILQGPALQDEVRVGGNSAGEATGVLSSVWEPDFGISK